MFFLISFVLANDYCVGYDEESCKNVCLNYTGNFSKIFYNMPEKKDLSYNGDTKHNIYVSKNSVYVNETFKNHNIIFCDPSFTLYYKNPRTILVNDHVYADFIQMPDNIHLEFQMNTMSKRLTVLIETTENSKIEEFIISANEYFFINFMFATDYIPESIIYLTKKQSKSINTPNITDDIRKLITNPSALDLLYTKYLCYSDKEENCEKYNSIHNFEYISTLNNIQYLSTSIYLVIETSKPEILYKEQTPFIHILGAAGSDLTLYNENTPHDCEYFTIIQPDRIETPNIVYEGEGKFTLVTSSNISLCSTTNKNKIDFTLKSKTPYFLNHSYIYPLRTDACFELDNKIKVHEYSLYHGSKCLLGLFERDSFLTDEELVTYNVTVDNLRETEFEYVNYYFKEGVHEIPVTWKRPCRFHGINPSKTHFIFSDVFKYDGRSIDNFIDVNYLPSSEFNNITIKPAKFFYLDSFRSIYTPRYLDRYTIQVDHNFTMGGSGKNINLDDDEISRDQCKITGKGTIFFYDREFMRQVVLFCQYDESINFEYNQTRPNYDICIGQSDLEKCISEITGIENINNRDWIWLRNPLTRSYSYYYGNTYITDKLNIMNFHFGDIIVTGYSVLTVLYKHYQNGDIYKNKYYDIEVESKTAKLIILFDRYDYYYYSYEKQILHLYPYENQTEFDFQFKFYYENVKLYMKYYYKFVEKSIKLSGKCQIYYREPYESRLSIFQVIDSSNVAFSVNPTPDYNQICFSDEPIESNSLYDFVHCSTVDEFKKYDSEATAYHFHSYIYLNLSINLYTNRFECQYYHFYNNITCSVNLPSDVVFDIRDECFGIYYGTTYTYLYFTSNEPKFTFNIRTSFCIDSNVESPIIPNVEFTSSYVAVEIIPYPSVRYLTREYQFIAADDFYIFSPAPQYLKGLFGPVKVNYSNSWTYYHMSDEGKLLYEDESFPSNKLENYELDEWNLSYNCVLAVGENDVLTIPLNWSYMHNFYILQGDYDFRIYKPQNLSYYHDGIVINHNCKIVAGNLNITIPEVSEIDIDYPADTSIPYFLYNAKLDCSENPKTKIFSGSVNVEYTYRSYSNIRIFGYGYPNDLTIISKDSDELWDFERSLSLYSSDNVKYRLDYDSICYCTSSNYQSKCSGKYFLVKDLTSLYTAVEDYPELNISVFDDIYLSHPTGYQFIFIIKDDYVRIGLPSSPDSMVISDNNAIKFNYSDSTYCEIINKATIYVYLKDKLDLDIKANTNSSIDFYLESDVFVTIDSIDETNFSIYVSNYYYHLYTEDESNLYEDIFNGTLEPYIKICAYDNDKSSSLCTYSKRDMIKNIFNDFFDYNVVQIALSSTPCNINLPSISDKANVNILPIEEPTVLSLSVVNDLQITADSIFINKYWNFTGETKVLKIYLNLYSALSVVTEMKEPIVLQLTNTRSYIDLRDFDEQSTSQITILKKGNEHNEITVYGNDNIFNNFVKNIAQYDGITIVRDGKQKYLCICNNIESCSKCKEGINGLITTARTVNSDPGEDVKIRVFTDFEMPSNVFINEHDVLIDPNFNLNLTNVYKVNQNIDEGLKVDNLKFINGSNLLLKPRDISLDIEMREEEMGPYFTIDVDTFLRLNVTNAENEKIQSSRLHVTGFGELNSYDYPYNRIRSVKTVKVIKGVYIVCNSRAGNYVCSYESARRYKQLGNSDFFRPEFDPNSKILVFLDSYTSNIKVKSGILNYQKIEFVQSPSNSRSLLEMQNKLILESTNLILSSENVTELSGSSGGASFDNKDSNLFVVGVDENLTIKQEGGVSKNSYTIQPSTEKVTIIVDDSVDIEKQKLKVESDKEISINVVTNKNVNNDVILSNFIEADENKVSIYLNDKNIRKPKKGLPIGAIVGIVVGVVAVIAVVSVVVAIFVVKQKNKNNEKQVLSEVDDDDELSDSTF